MKGCAAEGTRGLAAERVDNHDSRRLILGSRSSPTTRDERRQNPMVAGVLAAAAASAPTDYTRRGSRLEAEADAVALSGSLGLARGRGVEAAGRDARVPRPALASSGML